MSFGSRDLLSFCVTACTIVLQGPALLKKMAKAAERDGLGGIGLSNKHGPASTIVLMHREGLDDTDIANLSSSLGVRVLCLVDIMNSSSPASIGSLPSLTSDTLATIVYTSGTTGRPKVCSDFCFVSRLFTYGSLNLHLSLLSSSPSRELCSLMAISFTKSRSGLLLRNDIIKVSHSQMT